jgi:hypothetical protein
MQRSFRKFWTTHAVRRTHGNRDQSTRFRTPLPLDPAKKGFFEKGIVEIDELIEMGIVKECDSLWAALVVLVPNPDGTLRLCVDYRSAP